MGSAASDKGFSAQGTGRSEPEQQSLEPASTRTPEDSSSSGAASLSASDSADRAGEASDPDGEALFEVLRSETPLPPEEVPNIFAPEDRATCQTGTQKVFPGDERTSGAAEFSSSGAQTCSGRNEKSTQAVSDPSEEKAHAWQSAGPINPRWGRGGANKVYSSGGAGTPPGGMGGAWVWLPEGMHPPKAWRKRHPVLFWGGCLLIVLLAFGWGRVSVEDGPLTGPRIAVIHLDGLILDTTATIAWIEKIRYDSTIKGAVLRINSPGGAVGPSQELYAAIKRLDEVKPVIASMGALAASGGYYAALGARAIYASPSTLTASIGVKMQVPNIGGLMKTIGISEKTLTTGKLKDAGSSWRGMTPDEEAYLQSLLDDMFEEFIQIVAKERGLPLKTVRQLADGRAMTGRQALEAALVDNLGDQYEALRHVMRLCGLPESPPPKVVEGPEKPASIVKELLSGLLDISLEQRRAAEQPVFLY